MTPEYATPEQADNHWRAMGEPPSSRAYLMKVYFDGEAYTVQAPKSWPITSDEE